MIDMTYILWPLSVFAFAWAFLGMVLDIRSEDTIDRVVVVLFFVVSMLFAISARI